MSLTIITGFVTYTPDWDGYVLFFTNDLITREIIFDFIKSKFIEYGKGYEDYHLVFSFLISILFLLIVFIYSKQNIFLISLIFIPIIFLYQVTQIRFYFSYYLYFLSSYFILVKKKKIGILGVLISILNHYSLLLLTPIFYFFYKPKINLIKSIFIINIIVWVIFLFLENILLAIFGLDIYYLGYLDQGKISTFAGGVFKFFPIFVFQVYIILKIHQMNLLFDSSAKTKFLIIYILFPMFLILVSLKMQVIGQRFLISSFLFQLLFFFSQFQNRIRAKRIIVHALVVFFSLFYIYHFYFIENLLINNNTLNIVTKIISSNKLIK